MSFDLFKQLNVQVLADSKDLPLYGSGGFKLIWDTKFDAGMAAFLDCLQQFKVESAVCKKDLATQSSSLLKSIFFNVYP